MSPNPTEPTMNGRLKTIIAFWICPTLKDEIEALRDGNTKVILENQKLLARLALSDKDRE